MELVLERYKIAKGYTLSRLYENTIPKIFCLDVVELPIEGMVADRRDATISPGSYKIYLKGSARQCELSAVLQKVSGKDRSGFLSIPAEKELTQVKFRPRHPLCSTAMWVGHYETKTQKFVPDEQNFRRFMVRLIVARQQREKISLYVD